MDTGEIAYFMSDEHMFRGVFPRDKLPDIKRRPCGVIVNLDKSGEPGSHWIAIYFGKDFQGEYFDPLGLSPRLFPDIETYLRRVCKSVKWNNQQIQSVRSIACGLFCVHYLKNRFNGQFASKILSSFSHKNPELNDYLV
jgi:endoprotease